MTTTFYGNLDLLKTQSPQGFKVAAEFEMTCYDNETEQRQFMTIGKLPAEKKLLRLVLEPLSA